MEESDKNLLENLKNFEITKLFKKNTYIEISTNNSLLQGFIVNEKENQRFDVYIQKNRIELPINIFNLFGENNFSDEYKNRKSIININLMRADTQEIINNINKKLVKCNITLNNNINVIDKDNNSTISTNSSNNISTNNINSNKNKIPDKTGKMIDITGFYTHQFLEGYLLDCFCIIENKIKNNEFQVTDKIFFMKILDIIIFAAEIVKLNLNKYKSAYYNRKLLIVSQIHAILLSFDSIIYILTPNYKYNFNSVVPEIDKKLSEIAKLVYEIILASKSKNFIPLQSLIIFIKLLCHENTKKRIEKYNQKEVYDILNEHMSNLDKNELFFFKKDSSMRETCNDLVKMLFDNNMSDDIDKTYYSYLLSCLKCNSLEKKINALNDINIIINELQINKKINNTFKEFIEKNNILDIFFEESIHDEIMKRSYNLFSYLAKYDCLSDNIIEKIVQRKTKNEFMKKILIGIISELPKAKKNLLFNRLSQGLKFDIENTNNIEYILKLTESCFCSSELIDSNETKDSSKEEQIDIDEPEKKKEINYYGLNMIFEYIIKDFDDKIKYDKNNVDIALNSFVDAILNIIKLNSFFTLEDIFYFIEKLFENIKCNTKYNSIIQSIKIIHRLFIFFCKKKYRITFNKNLKKLDEKYEIISLLINDLIRYMKLLPNDYSNGNGKDTVYEGIYPHFMNVEERLNLIFYFYKKNLNNYGLVLEGKKYIENIYEIFKLDNFNEERKKLYSIITKIINQIDHSILMEFFTNILRNKEELDLKSINDIESTNFIIQIFKQINFNKKSILNDGRNIRIAEDQTIEGIDFLFDLLTQNPNQKVQEKISELLTDVCLSHKKYNTKKISEYWKSYFDKINIYLDIIINTHDKIALNGIINLINKIYSSSINCYGKIPNKSDYQVPKESYKFYNFKRSIPNKKDKENRLKVGNYDKIVDIRYKIGYYFDIPVNNVAFVDINGNVYDINNDFEIFVKIFSDEQYFYNKGFEYVQIKDIPFGLLEMKDNPKLLIETNDKIYNILINNLKIDLNNEYNEEISKKQKIWNIIINLPKNFYFENKLKNYGNKEKINDNSILDILDIKQIYLMTYSLQCLYESLNNQKEEEIEHMDKNQYLNNFIEIHHMDKLIIDKLLEINLEPKNCHPIQIECLSILIKVLNDLEIYKESKEPKIENIINDENLLNNILKKLTELISNLLELDYNTYKNYLIQDNDDINEDNFDDENEEIYENISSLVENIFIFIDEITKGNKSYMSFIFNNKELFIKIFINNYIKCENGDLKKNIEEYLSRNCENNSENINKYLDIILTVDIFNYLVNNDKSGKYFNIISSILQINFDKFPSNHDNKNNEENKESKIVVESKHIEQSKKIIDLILNYIQTDLESTKEEKEEKLEERDYRKLLRNKENFKEGIILFLSNVLNINSKELINYISNKVDICDFFLNKCNLRKCVEKPLEAKYPFCLNNQSKGAIYTLLLNILKKGENNDDLKMKIINVLDNNNKLGFWKTFHSRNWELESRDITKGKYIGLYNLHSTCYLNSIIQQLFMIPMLREEIIKIENPYNNNVLYELQLLFSALKIYEFPYYNPCSFVLANNLNFYDQKDADEFYGTLIDRIESDIKRIYAKDSKNENNDGKMDIEKEDNNKNKDGKYKYKDIFNNFFEIKVLDELQFVDCGHKRYNEFCYNNIQLEIKDFSNIYDSLRNYFKTEVMEGDNKINCEQCKTKRICHKHLLLKSLPNILVISLKRFEFDYNTMLKYKLNKYFEFPLNLDMKDYLIENHSEKNTEYELTGITIHWGLADFGHYYDLIKGEDNKWYKFNDTSVSEFKEEDIPKEAYGEKDCLDDDSFKDNNNKRNNAYILFYTKKGRSFDNKELALSNNKYNNLKKETIEIINLKLYKEWIIKNIFSTSYQHFVLDLLKMDLEKIIDIRIEKYHPKLFEILKNEGYFKNNIEKKENEKIEKEDNNKIFQFGLRYYFNVILRILRKTQSEEIFDTFKEIINIYMENDLNKAKYIIEEFSNSETIEEYFVYCPNSNSSSDCNEILVNAIKLLFKQNNNNSNENSIIFLFFNTWFSYIAKYLRVINLENVNSVFYKFINMDSKTFLNHLRKKNIDDWVKTLYKRGGSDHDYAKYFNESNFPTIKSNHFLLTEKTLNSENNSKTPTEVEDDISDQQLFRKLNDSKSNEHLKEQLGSCLLDH